MISHITLNNKPVIFSDWHKEQLYDLSEATFATPFKFAYELFIVSEKYVCRPDLLSIDIYGDNSYADVICKLNGISNPFELNTGMVLLIPGPDEIDKFRFIPKKDDGIGNINNTDSNKPIAKAKNEKRKANESLIGDSRFKIDKKRGVVIY